MPLKIGAYVRVSTEEQANIVEGSLDSQQHRMNAYIDLKNHQEKNWGKVIETYIDDGYSAKDTRRPAYQRMLRDLRTGKINLILVTDLSRLSRNINDFCKLLEELTKFKAKFLSIKEQFDSSTPAGEMMLFNMINLAQFERKQTSERVSLNFHSRALRGLSNGGCDILGYDRDPTNSGKFIVKESEALVVRRVFQLYLESRSLAETARKLMDEGHVPKVHSEKRARLARDGKWTLYSVRTVLKNMAYIGLREINRAHKDEDQDQLKPWHRYQVVQAAWPAIMNEEVFREAQKVLDEGKSAANQRLSVAEKRVFLLSGIIRCGVCGRALIGQTSHGATKIHRYYGHSKIDVKDKACSEKNLRAELVEQAVINHLDETLSKSGYLDKIEGNIKSFLKTNTNDLKNEREAKEQELRDIEIEIESAFKFHFSMDKNSQAFQLVTEKLEKLAEHRKVLRTQLENIKNHLDVGSDAKLARVNLEGHLEKFQHGWKKANPAVQKRLMRRIFDCLIYTREGIKAYYFTDTTETTHDHEIKNKKAEGTNPLAFSFLSVNQTLRRLMATSERSVKSASAFVSGAPIRI